MANIKNENVKVKAKILDTDVTIKSKIGTKDVKVKSNINIVPSATTERKGIIRIATEQEAIEGVDNTTAITPYTLSKVIISDKTYTHEQGISSDTWVIEHNLGKHPSVTVVDTAGTVFTASVEYNSDNVCTVYINGATKGKAYLN